MIVRPYAPADIDASTALIRDAFWNVYHPGATEHLIWHRLVHGHPDRIPELTLVAALDEEVVGAIATTRARLIPSEGDEIPALVLGPVAVSAAHRRRGIGAALVKASIEIARRRGERGIFLYGSPDHYSRFGFAEARRWGVTMPDGQSMDAFQGLELTPGSLDGASGRLLESQVYTVEDRDIDAFDARFPAREKRVLPGQL